MSRNICVITGSRSEFGLLRFLMESVNNNPTLTLQVVASGMHLSPEFGSTYVEIEEAGFHIDGRVEMLLGSDTKTAVTKSMGLGIIGFSDVYERLKPDMLVVLGDRFETLSAVSAAMIAGIPVAHLHGGEITEGAFDDAIRHSITKMSHLHFVAADEYRQRVIQLGEQPDRVYNVGAMVIDAIKRIELMSREDLERSLNKKLGKTNLLVTYHPVTLDSDESSICQMHELLAALGEVKDANIIFTMPNADTGGRELGKVAREFALSHSNVQLYNSLGQLRYLSCLAQSDGVVGNSSSGLIEAPFFNIGTINIGDRQKGRLKAPSVIDCEPNRESIAAALNLLCSAEFKAKLVNNASPYGSGGASEAITRVLAEHPLENLLKKKFYNLPVGNIS